MSKEEYIRKKIDDKFLIKLQEFEKKDYREQLLRNQHEVEMDFITGNAIKLFTGKNGDKRLVSSIWQMYLDRGKRILPEYPIYSSIYTVEDGIKYIESFGVSRELQDDWVAKWIKTWDYKMAKMDAA